MKIRKNLVIKILMVIVIITFIYKYLYAVISFNDDPIGNSTGMNGTIIDGTSMLLKSNADAFLLLNEVEIAENSDFNFSYALYLTNSVIEKLLVSKDRYLEVIEVGKNMPFKGELIQKYKDFDYKAFAAEYCLNQETMAEVSTYLENADFAGIFKKGVEDIDDILFVLEEIKTEISKGIKPDIQLFWSLLQKYNNLGLFGNYATLVFNTI